MEILSELVEGMLYVLHVFFDSFHVDSSLLRTVISLGSHRRASGIEVTATTLVKERRL